MDAENLEMLNTFQEECFELLVTMEDALLNLQSNGASDEYISSMFRAIHTVKGGAGIFGLEKMVHFTHLAENLLSEIRSGSIEINDDILSLFFDIKDHLAELLESVVKNEGTENYSDYLSHTTENFVVLLNKFLNNEPINDDEGENSPENNYDSMIDEINTQMLEVNSIQDEAESLETLSFEDEINKLIMQNQRKQEEIIKKSPAKETKPKQPAKLVEADEKILIQPEIVVQKKESPKKDVEKLIQGESKSAQSSSTLKIDSIKIDSLINLVGEIVIANANVAQHANRVKDRELSESVHVLSRMIEEIREASMQTRMVPIGETFSRFKRVVRDLSKELNKDIELVIIGGETELDKTVTEKISDPLIHLIRNSIDHGIEQKEVRVAKNKNPKSILKLKASHEAGSIVIQVIDDGKGLDSQAILRKAIEKTIISEHDSLNQKEIFNLIMMPGFSTAEQVSKLSGRGVGMDVVRKNVEELRGTIDLDSMIDVGTTITIRLPLTLAIIEGFMVKVSGQLYIVPLEMIVECLELTKEYKAEITNNSYINLRGNVLPLLDMRTFFNLSKDEVSTLRENIVVVNFAGSTVGLIVDELVGEFQTVIKPLSKIFKNAKGIGGATILGNGQVSLILDIPMLLQQVNHIADKTKVHHDSSSFLF